VGRRGPPRSIGESGETQHRVARNPYRRSGSRSSMRRRSRPGSRISSLETENTSLGVAGDRADAASPGPCLGVLRLVQMENGLRMGMSNATDYYREFARSRRRCCNNAP
jgi:hypothetical protein